MVTTLRGGVTDPTRAALSALQVAASSGWSSAWAYAISNPNPPSGPRARQTPKPLIKIGWFSPDSLFPAAVGRFCFIVRHLHRIGVTWHYPRRRTRWGRTDHRQTDRPSSRRPLAYLLGRARPLPKANFAPAILVTAGRAVWHHSLENTGFAVASTRRTTAGEASTMVTKKEDPYYSNTKGAAKKGLAPKPRPYKPPKPPK